ncbi:hypothetical protein [Bradyrhizobium sp. SZCCHNRI1073]|uniref:hypothetical protein n=1 Tax=Bradyrhizobium sp. SZCCHNRI1073 TaxID=3057280 RepID=UPI002916A604|nr:hypothetical protein [Bradyrhizobium sp. SZCCHNRI1073]
MTFREAVVKPFAAGWRARAYFAIALWLLSQIPKPFAQPDPSWWQELINKGVGSFDKIAYVVALAGIVYVVISDVLDYVWANSLQIEVRKGFVETGNVLRESLADFTSGLVGMTFESVKVWIEGGRGKPDQVRTIAKSALISSYGAHNNEPESFLSFSLDDLLDNWATANSQTWENLFALVTIRPSTIQNHFEWEERRTYNLVCMSRCGQLPIKLEGSYQISAPEIIKALGSLDFQVRFGSNTIIDFKKWWSAHKVDQLEADGTLNINEEGILIRYNGTWLSYEFNKTCDISLQETEVEVYERAFISQDDRCYILAVRHPTRGIRLSLTLEGLDRKWTVKAPIASSMLYKKGISAVTVSNYQKYTSSASLTGWTLPGVALVVEWSPS